LSTNDFVGMRVCEKQNVPKKLNLLSPTPMRVVV
jgi:hypothetical protein